MRFFAIVMVVGLVFAEFSYGQSVPAVDIDPGTQIGDSPTDDQFEGSKLPNDNIAQGWSFEVLEPLKLNLLGVQLAHTCGKAFQRQHGFVGASLFDE